MKIYVFIKNEASLFENLVISLKNSIFAFLWMQYYQCYNICMTYNIVNTFHAFSFNIERFLLVVSNI